MRRELTSAAICWVSRLVTAAAQLLAVRFAIERTGTEGFAIFALMIGLAGWFLLVDCGFGSSLQNFLAESRGDRDRWCKLVTVAWFLFTGSSVLVCLGLAVSAGWFGPRYLGQFQGLQSADKGWVFFVGACISTLTATGGIAYRVLFAEGKSCLANLLPATGAVLGLGLTWLMPPQAATRGVLMIIVAFTGPSALIAMLTMCWLASRNWAGRAALDRGLIAAVAHRAKGFWLFMLLGLLVLQVDCLVISQLLNQDQIVQYSIGMRLFGLLLFFHAALLSAMWPECTVAIKADDWLLVQTMTRRVLVLGTILVVFGAAAIYSGLPFVVDILAPGQRLSIPGSFVLLLALYTLVRVWADTFAILLQSANEMRPFWKLVPAQALISIFAQLWLAPRYGVHGVLAGIMASFMLTVVWGLPLAVVRMRGAALMAKGKTT